MNHPEKILRTLDGNLSTPARLILYGRAALALGFPEALPAFFTTLDVDAILPKVELAAIDANDDFWSALEKTNEQLEADGLYFTHLFVDEQLILTPDWLSRIVEIDLEGLANLELYRPAVGDLILTKMMRVDPQDREDIHFLVQELHGQPMESFLAGAIMPDIPEIRDAFAENTRWLHETFRDLV